MQDGEHSNIPKCLKKFVSVASEPQIGRCTKLLTNLAQAIDKCRINTLYMEGRASLICSKSSLLFLIEHFVDELIAGVHPRNLEDVSDALEAVCGEDWCTTDHLTSVQARYLCPGGLLRAQMRNCRFAIYDTDGIEQLAGMLPSTKSVPHACILQGYTCSPRRIVSLATMKRLFVPPALQSCATELMQRAIHDTRCEQEIATQQRSLLFCGPSAEAIVASKRGTGRAPSARRTTTSSFHSAVERPTRTVGVKWNESLVSQSLAFLGQEDDAETATMRSPTSPHAPSPLTVGTTIDDSDSDSDSDECIDPKKVLDDVFNEMAAEEDIVDDPPAMDKDGDEDENDDAITTGTDGPRGGLDNELNALGRLDPAVQSRAERCVRRLARARPTHNVPTRFGAAIYDSPRYILHRRRFAEIATEPVVLTCGPASDPSFQNWIDGEGGHEQVLLTTSNCWIDMLCAQRIRGNVIDESHPCSCVTELVVRISDALQVEIARDVCNILANGADTTGGADALYKDRVALLAAGVELATGTLCVATAIDPIFCDFVARYTNVLMNATKGTLIRHNTSNEGLAHGCARPRDIVVRRWIMALDALKTQLVRSDSTPLMWSSAFIAPPVTVSEAVQDLAATHMFGRVQNLVGSILRFPDAKAEIYRFAAPNAWPCDVCWTCSVAADVLAAPNILTVGAAVVAAEHRTYMVCSEATSTDPLVAGAMILALDASISRFPCIQRPKHPVTLYPFVALVLAHQHRARQHHTSAELPLPLIHASVGFVANMLHRCWNKVTGVTHNFLPSFSKDFDGAPTYKMAIESARLLYPHERLALYAMASVWDVLLIAASSLAEHNRPKRTLRGIVCTTRPFRQWAVDSRIVSTLAQLPEWISTERFHEKDALFVKICAKGDLHTRTLTNLAILRFIIEHRMVLLLQSLALLPEDNDKSRGTIPWLPFEREFLATAINKGTTLAGEHPAEYLPVNQDLLLKAYTFSGVRETLLSMSDTERAALDSVLGLFHDLDPRADALERALTSTDLTTATLSCSKGIPLAIDDEQIIRLSSSWMPIFGNPMTLDPDTSAQPPCLLPKNSILLDELVHNRFGLVVSVTALPSHNGLIAGNYSDDYPLLAIKELCKGGTKTASARCKHAESIAMDAEVEELEKLYGNETMLS